MNYLFPQFYLAQNFLPFPFTWLMPLLLWHIVWKGFALWHAAKNNQRNWFVALLIINTAGILDILYLVFFQKHCCENCCQEEKVKLIKPKRKSQSK